MNTRFDKRLANIPPEIITKVARIDELKGRWVGGLQLNPQTLGRLKRSVLVTSTGSSTRIEGAKLSDEEVENLMRGVKAKTFADRDSQEVKGYFDLLQNVFDSWRTIKLSENTIKHFHNELVKLVDKDQRHRGHYKKVENAVEMFDRNGKSLGVVFSADQSVSHSQRDAGTRGMDKCGICRKIYHPLLIIGNFIVEFLNIHPFQDGNGRLSRFSPTFFSSRRAIFSFRTFPTRS